MKRIKLVAATAAMALAAFGFAAPVVAAEGTEEEVATEEVVEAQEGEATEGEATHGEGEEAEDGECAVDPNLSYELSVMHVDADKLAYFQKLWNDPDEVEIREETSDAWLDAQLFKGGPKDAPYLDIQRKDLKDGDTYEAKVRTFPGYKFKGTFTELGHNHISGTIKADVLVQHHRWVDGEPVDEGDCIQLGDAAVVLVYEKEDALADTGAHGITTAGVIAAAMLAAGSGLVAVRRRRA